MSGLNPESETDLDHDDFQASDARAVPDGRYHVMFVDDEVNVLSGLSRMLRWIRDSWEMTFVSSGAEALEVLERCPVDAIVSDMKMPLMNGAELLAQVQARYPSTARLVLSGEADPDTVLDVVRSAQQFLAKPCDAETLTSAVNRALSVQRSLSDPALRALIGGVSALPTLPAVYDQLVAAVSSPDVDMAEVSAIVSSDVATSAELLKLVNSAFFGPPRQVYSVNDAVRLLGLDNVQALVLASSLFHVNEALTWILNVEELRVQSLRRAAIAREIARLEKWTTRAKDIAVLSCMLRDVGLLVLTEGRPEATVQLLAAIDAEPEPPSAERLHELEISAYGCSVPQASAYLLGLWGFTPAIVHTIAVQPLAEGRPGVTKFERVLSFTTGRAGGSLEHIVPLADDYMTVERALAWNLAADEAIAREGVPLPTS